MALRRTSALAVSALAAVTALSTAFTRPAQAQPAEEFYRGKREIILITSSAPGGGYDSYSRLLGRHMSKYLPGNPTIIVQNMVGGGGIRAANYLYNVAPRDGTVFSLIDRGMPTAPLLYGEKSQALFDAVKFSWIGSIMRETGMGVISARSPVKTVDDAKRQEIVFGATGIETDPALYVRLVNELLQTRIKVITGYKGQPEQFQAVEKGELDGLFMSGWSGNGRAYVLDRMARGEMRLLVQMASVQDKDPQQATTPAILELVTAPQDRQVVQLILDRLTLGRPLIAPPELPADRLAMLRKTFRQAIEDPELRAEAERQRLAINPAFGDEADEVIRRLYRTPPDVLERARKIVGISSEH